VKYARARREAQGIAGYGQALQQHPAFLARNPKGAAK
jgi:hypothetical protein